MHYKAPSYCECSVAATAYVDNELSVRQALGVCKCGREKLNTATQTHPSPLVMLRDHVSLRISVDITVTLNLSVY